MDIRLPLNFDQSPRNFLQRCGYVAFTDPNSGQQSFTRRFGRDFYPRFHIYLKDVDGQPVMGLHLDQKKPSYPGAHAHSGEYDGTVVEQEAARISGLLKNQLGNQAQQQPSPKRGLFHHLFR